MRLWSLRPAYLDARGLVALWREGLLAQAVLQGRAAGYTRHPQLLRFRQSGHAAGCIASYLREVHREAARRGFAFDAGKIGRARWQGELPVTRGQLDYEWRHLVAKLERRDPEWLRRFGGMTRPRAHPIFRVVPGDVESWERRR